MKKIIKFLKPYICRNLRDITVYMTATVCLWLIDIISPYITGLYIDSLIARTGISPIIYFVILVGIINGINILTQYLTALISTKVNNKLLYQIINDMYQQIFQSNLSAYKDIDKSCLIDQIGDDSENVVDFFSENIMNIVLQFITIIASGIIIFRVDILLCVIIFSLIPIYAFLYFVFRKKLYNANLKYKTQSNEYFSKKAEQVTKVEFVKRNMVMCEMNKRLANAFQAMYKAALKQVKVNYVFSNLSQFVSIICYLCVIGIGGYKVFTYELSIGFFSIINTYFSMIISSTAYFLSLAGAYQEAKVSVNRLNRIYHAEPEVYGTKKIEHADKITLNSLSVKYDNTTVIDRLSFTFEKGKIYLICGENGSGKTTILNCIAGLYTDLCTGDILFDNIPITEIDMPDLRRRRISFVEQSPEFLNLSMEEYLSFGLELNKNMIKHQEELRKSFGLDQLATHTKINESGNNFSGGEKQKLSIVRAFSKQSFLVILDEPTSALDHESVEILTHILQFQKNNKITLIVSHDSRISDICDESLYL